LLVVVFRVRPAPCAMVFRRLLPISSQNCVAFWKRQASWPATAVRSSVRNTAARRLVVASSSRSAQISKV